MLLSCPLNNHFLAAKFIKIWGTTQEGLRGLLQAPALHRQQKLSYTLCIYLKKPLPICFIAAMIIKTWGTTQEAAEGYWKHRWAIYVIKAERRLPRSWVQRMRLGQLTYDPVSDKRVHR
jgi:hypothetical protein